MIIIKLVTEKSELVDICALNYANRRCNLTDDEAKSQGFVTAEFTIEFLQLMHGRSPSVIAKDENKVVGYALVATKEMITQHCLLIELFDQIDLLSYNETLLSDIEYVGVGQLCVAKEYRGMNLAQQLYEFFKFSLEKKYRYCITDVAVENQRSLKAHMKTGFQVIATSVYGGTEWHVLLWDWENSPPCAITPGKG
mmetsp:Transcript_13667/g.13212  ORF Transcript_13667/g.13212 Transcript_13667/m.13212 type:complete len:196 (+) Transcript_13667:221-808(+)